MYQSLSFAACVDPFRSVPPRPVPSCFVPSCFASYRVVSYCIVSSESVTIVPIRSDPLASHALGPFRVNLNFNTLSSLGSPRITDSSSGPVRFFAFAAVSIQVLACACECASRSLLRLPAASTCVCPTVNGYRGKLQSEQRGTAMKP